ncbi:S-adenosyl-L-homocysteine hydrolase [Novosphingobium sp.]|uniref:S-adenosyl-L-homocysteine hydrolase n=1 Tax=Novosphingobium sp. TaxID=1874826 RepID=UPI00260C6711|nr:S-adenosyl-L-homocysteine hydrolase [Novosphingobium sp.]
MHGIRTGFAALAAIGTLLATPAIAGDIQEAEKLRRLDIMLMVTALRCRTTEDNFQPDFAAFEASHLSELNDAALQLRKSLVATNGLVGASRELDRISTGMANQYGQGHPRLDCAELKQVTRLLANTPGRATLLAAADELLEPTDRPRLASAAR